MRAIQYEKGGPSSVLTIVEREPLDPAADEVQVRVIVSGVNPTDWKSRSRGADLDRPQVPNQDGAGIVEAVGSAVADFSVGDRVWLWDVAYGSSEGTAQEFVTLPARQVMPLPDSASFDEGASLGIPALTAHLALRAGVERGSALGPESLSGHTVLVTGGAGAVGHAAIQLAKWAGATVITTVSSVEKGRLARAAGAEHVINYRTDSVPMRVREVAPEGADLIVDVAISENIADSVQCLAPSGTIASYAWDATPELAVSIGAAMVKNVRLRFLLTYTAPESEKRAALEGVQAALEGGVLRVGEDAGLPITRFSLGETAGAHDAVERGTVGKVLIDVSRT